MLQIGFDYKPETLSCPMNPRMTSTLRMWFFRTMSVWSVVVGIYVKFNKALEKREEILFDNKNIKSYLILVNTKFS